ncbi:MAG: hypothetical protein ABJO02_14580 [Reichenbachiella sp.]|uniref:hypothetical protein n=1 Tax=Reichenbachiella sp. TaxID=2184521 RepID=UPI0032979E15
MMEVKENIDQIPAQQDVQSGDSTDFKMLLNDGIETIQDMSGQKWTNYNPSDPGMTILEHLCFALLDLGYRGQFSMQDLLTAKNHTLPLKNGLLPAEDILFTNPVTSNDIRKLLIDRTEGIKNAWVTINNFGKSAKAFKVTVELDDYAKATWIDSESNGTGKTINGMPDNLPKSLSKEIRLIMAGISGLLYQHRNLGDYYQSPKLLRPALITLGGSFHFKSTVNIEQSIAELYYVLNNYLSSYIKFHTYQELAKADLLVGEIMSGPKLANGFVLDDNLQERRLVLDPNQMRSDLLSTNKFNSIFDFSINLRNTTKVGDEGQIKIDQKTSPFFDFSRVSTEIKYPERLKFYYGNKQVRSIDQAKVDNYYKSLTDRNPVSNYNFKDSLAPKLPQGNYRNIEQYYSIQNMFPELYGLKTNDSFDGVPERKRGQIKQLKAYLMMFEQVIADHLSQLSHLSDLYSFDSGIKAGNMLCQTYYPNRLYDVPGAKFIVKAYDVFRRENAYLDDHPHKTWKNFQKDEYNQYAVELADYGTTTENNIKRKSTMLGHLYARYGGKYDLEGLLDLNSKYGDYDLAKVENISRLLKKFPTYSGNLGRSYFKEERPIDKTSTSHKSTTHLFSGMERKLDLDFNLNGYIEGFLGEISNPKSKSTKHSFHKNLSTINCLGEDVFQFQYNSEEYHKALKCHLYVTQKFIEQTKGFILIDHALLVDSLKQAEWNVAIKYGESTKLTGKKFNLSNAVEMAAVLSDKHKSMYFDVMHKTKSNEHHSLNDILSSPQVSIMIPGWIPKFNEIKPLLLKELYRQGPIHLSYQVYRLNAPSMNHILNLRAAWLCGISDLQRGNRMSPKSKDAGSKLLALIKKPTSLNSSTIGSNKK